MAPETPHRGPIFRWTAGIFLATLFISSSSTPKVDPDLFHEMALFREAVALGRLPDTDIFAYTATLPEFVQHEWGAGAIAWVLATLLGAPGILLLRFLLALAIAIFVLRVARARTTDLPAAFFLPAAAAVLCAGSAFSPVRGHLYSLAATAVLLWLLDRDRRGNRRWIPVWFAILVVWLNVHGGFTFGLILMAVHAGEELLRRRPWRHLAAVLGGSLAVIAANPYGLSYYTYLWHALRMPRPDILEWRPLWEVFPAYHTIAFGISLLLVLYSVWRTGVAAAPGIALLGATAGAALLHQRFLPFYAVALAAYGPGYLEATRLGGWIRRQFDRPAMALQAAVTMGVVFFAMVAVAGRAGTIEVPSAGKPGDDLVYPAGPVQYLAEIRFRGNVMTPFEYGAFVSWRLYPAVRVSMDSRYETAYATWWADESFRCYRAAPGWQKTLTAFPTDVVMARRDGPLAKALPTTTWKRVYLDRAYELWARPGLDLPVVSEPDRVVRTAFP